MIWWFTSTLIFLNLFLISNQLQSSNNSGTRGTCSLFFCPLQAIRFDPKPRSAPGTQSWPWRSRFMFDGYRLRSSQAKFYEVYMIIAGMFKQWLLGLFLQWLVDLLDLFLGLLLLCRFRHLIISILRCIHVRDLELAKGALNHGFLGVVETQRFKQWPKTVGSCRIKQTWDSMIGWFFPFRYEYIHPIF